jgi:cobalamin biosynthesis protein CobD/CbiB
LTPYLLLASPPVESLAETIRLAVTPVFLLAGISGLLGVITARLSRIVDRARLIKAREAVGSLALERELEGELATQRRRMGLASGAFACAATSFLLVAMVVMVLFLSTLASIDLTLVVALLFVLAMGSLMAAVSLLLREVHLAIQALRRF